MQIVGHGEIRHAGGDFFFLLAEALEVSQMKAVEIHGDNWSSLKISQRLRILCQEEIGVECQNKGSFYAYLDFG